MLLKKEFTNIITEIDWIDGLSVITTIKHERDDSNKSMLCTGI